MGGHVPAARRKLKMAILARPAGKVRKVWRPGRRGLACPRLPLEPARRGKEPEVASLADAVAKRGRQGHQHPAGARPSGLRGGRAASKVRPQRRGALLGIARATGCSKRTVCRGHVGSGLKRGVSRRQAADRTAWYRSLKPYWGQPTVRNVRGGDWQRGGWWDEAPAPPSKERRAETPNLRLRAPVLYPTGVFLGAVLYLEQALQPDEVKAAVRSCGLPTSMAMSEPHMGRRIPS
jgi:hypothetical protein